MEIKSIEAVHYPAITAIYLDGIATGKATFQTTAPPWDDWDKSHLVHSRLAAFINNAMAGWAALTPTSGRCVYAGVAEVSVYIAAAHRGKGVGEALLKSLINSSESNGLWTLQSGIFSTNIASIKLHEKCGFRMVGYREKIGQLDGKWKDNVLMERRSKIIGF